MELVDFYPSPDALQASELSVLDFLRNNTYINERHPQVAIDANTSYPSNKRSCSGFEFHSHFDMSNESMRSNREAHGGQDRPESNARLIVSVLIRAEKNAFQNVSYCLSVCRIESGPPVPRLTILRKFHFDVAVASKAAGHRRLPHPRCHLQYCGEMYPYMAKLGCSENQLDEMHPWLSEPRMFFWPMSLALLIDMALHEFPDQGSAKFRADSYWRHLVRSQERLVLRPFYEKCIEVIADARGQKRTLADAFYIS